MVDMIQVQQVQQLRADVTQLQDRQNGTDEICRKMDQFFAVFVVLVSIVIMTVVSTDARLDAFEARLDAIEAILAQVLTVLRPTRASTVDPITDRF